MYLLGLVGALIGGYSDTGNEWRSILCSLLGLHNSLQLCRKGDIESSSKRLMVLGI